MQIVFLLYSNRSGSTFLSSKMSQIDNVNVTIEATFSSLLIEEGTLEYAKKDVDKIISIIRRDKKFKEWHLSEEELATALNNENTLTIDNIIKAILKAEYNIKEGVVIVKDTRISRHLNVVHSYIPLAKFIHVVRDPRAVINSQLKSVSSNSGLKMAVGPYSAALVWQRLVRAISQLSKNDVLTVYYEKIIDKTDEEVLRICDFLNIAMNQRLAGDDKSYFDRIPETQKHLHGLVAKEGNMQRKQAWQNELSSNHEYIIDSVLTNELNTFGYEIRSNQRQKRFVLIASMRCVEFFKRMKVIIYGLLKDTSKRQYYLFRIKGMLKKAVGRSKK